MSLTYDVKQCAPDTSGNVMLEYHAICHLCFFRLLYTLLFIMCLLFKTTLKFKCFDHPVSFPKLSHTLSLVLLNTL